MNNKSASEKYNIIFIILLFVIPLLSLNVSFFYLSYKNKEWALKDQEKKALQEAETLSSEANFGIQIEALFGKFFETINNDSQKKQNKDFLSAEYLRETANRVFSKPFPQHHFYVFKFIPKTSKTDLIFYKGDIKSGKRGLCLAFEHLYNLKSMMPLLHVRSLG